MPGSRLRDFRHSSHPTVTDRFGTAPGSILRLESLAPRVILDARSTHVTARMFDDRDPHSLLAGQAVEPTGPG